jgi:hypothetical protein
VLITVSPNPSATGCSSTSRLTDTVAAATGLPTLPKGCVRASTGVGFVCSKVANRVRLRAVYKGSPGTSAISKAVVTNHGTTNHATTTSGFNPGRLTVAHTNQAVQKTCGGMIGVDPCVIATDDVALQNLGPRSMAIVKEQVGMRESGSLLHVTVSSSPPATCQAIGVLAHLAVNCTLTGGLAPGATWTVSIQGTLTKPATNPTERLGVLSPFTFSTPDTASLTARNRVNRRFSLAS